MSVSPDFVLDEWDAIFHMPFIKEKDKLSYLHARVEEYAATSMSLSMSGLYYFRVKGGSFCERSYSAD